MGPSQDNLWPDWVLWIFESRGVWALLFEESEAAAKWPVCCLGRSPLLHLSCQQSMSLSLQIQLWQARNSRFITPDLFPSRNLPMPLKFQGCISQWGRNQGDDLCLEVSHDIMEWDDGTGKTTDRIFVLKCVFSYYIKSTITFQKGFTLQIKIISQFH